MGLSPVELFHFLLILILFLGLSQSLGFLFEWFHQPRVIGEICAGLLLGSTVLKTFVPGIYEYLFTQSPAAVHAIAGFQELGLLLLMFCSGFELRLLTKKAEGRLAAVLSLTGLAVPVLVTVALLPWLDLSSLMGPEHDLIGLQIIFVIATAVTSIPVLSKILIDLKLMSTRFARLALSVAVIDDIVLYGLLSAVMARVRHDALSLDFWHSTLGIEKGSSLDLAASAGLTVLLFGLAVLAGPKLFYKLKNGRLNLLVRGNSAAYLVVVLCVMTVLSVLLGIEPIFGAFVAGVIVGRDRLTIDHEQEEALATIKGFSFSTFIPLYFAITGWKLDLIHQTSWLFFVAFFAGSTLLKSVGVFLGAKLEKISNFDAVNFAIALNARGGPGIVLATLTFNAGLINEIFFSTLVLTALATSFLSGSYLRSVRNRILQNDSALTNV